MTLGRCGDPSLLLRLLPLCSLLLLLMRLLSGLRRLRGRARRQGRLQKGAPGSARQATLAAKAKRGRLTKRKRVLSCRRGRCHIQQALLSAIRLIAVS